MIDRRPTVSRKIKEFARDGMILLVDPDRPAWAMVNTLGSKIASLCNGKRSVEDIVTSLLASYAVSRDVLTRDVNTFLGMLEKAGLVYYGDPPPIERRSLADQVSPISSVCFELTERCNLRCAHCFEEAGARRTPDPLTGTVMSWIDKFAEAGAIINLSGGEFFTRTDWRDLVSHLAATKAQGVILTNGTLIDDHTAAELARITQGAPFTFQVSLDGSDPETNDPVRGKGSFDRITNGIRMLTNHGLAGQTAISFTPNGLNIGKLDEMLNLAQDLRVRTFHISILHRMGRATGIWRRLKPTNKQMVEFLDALHTKGEELEGKLRISGDYCSLLHDKIRRIPSPITIGCRLGVDVKVDPTGDVYPCPPLSYDRKYCIGNINEMTPEEIVHSPVLRGLREQFIPRVEQSNCRSCAWKCFCGAGCMARAEQNYGTIFHGDDLCGLAKELYPRTFFRQAQAQRSAVHAKAA